MTRQTAGIDFTLPESIRGEVDLSSAVEIAGVPYLHLRTTIGDDLYLTDAGLRYIDELMPDKFARNRDWFNSVKVPLDGSSTPFRIPLKSTQVLFKWNRMATDPMIPGWDAVFNSPFEEFSLAQELETRLEGRLRLQLPLAIYVPSEHHTLETLQRRRHLIDFIRRNEGDEYIDMHRDYAVIYEWAPGLDLYQFVLKDELELRQGEVISAQIADLLDELGYAVTDHKMSHLVASSSDTIDSIESLTLIDFELLHRTADHETTRRNYRRQCFYEIRYHEARLSGVESDGSRTIFGVPYIEGPVESSGGYLWVAGHDKQLFDYFLPEKWQTTPRRRLNRLGISFYTESKDGIPLVIKTSRVGELPPFNPLHREEKELLTYGYNSPFEEASIADKIAMSGLSSARLLAIYLMNQEITISDYLHDDSRYSSHTAFKTRGGEPLLLRDRQYLTIWQYWQGSDQEMMISPQPPLTPVSLDEAFLTGLVDRQGLESMLRFAILKLSSRGYRDLQPKPTHLILAVGKDGSLIRDETGIPLFRYSNFSLVRQFSGGLEN